LSSILYLEKSKRYAEEFVKKLNEVSEYIRGLPQEQLKVFCSWLLRIVRPQVIDQMKNMIDDLLKKVEEEGVDDVGDFIFNVQQLIQEYYKQAEEKGKEKGYEEGIEEGIKQGIEKGSKETLMNIVKNMILAGADDNFIAKVTGLEIEQIKKVRSNLMN